jgi:hypothetical protein
MRDKRITLFMISSSIIELNIKIIVLCQTAFVNEKSGILGISP